jgi:hypothetical protein
MGRIVEVADPQQASFLPACLEDYVDGDNPVRIIDAFVDELDLAQLGFARVQPASTGRPGYAPGTMLKLYVYGYLHQLTLSRKLPSQNNMSDQPRRVLTHGVTAGSSALGRNESAWNRSGGCSPAVWSCGLTTGRRAHATSGEQP